MAVAELRCCGGWGTDGQLDPSHETIARDVACCARSVRRATAMLRALGLVHRQQRLVRDGSCVAQTRNQYVLSVVSVMSLTRPSRLGGGHSGRQTRRNRIKKEVCIDDVVAAQTEL